MTHISALVLLTASLLLWTPAQASLLCVWTKVLPNDEVHHSFLRRDSASLRLYHSAWSGARTLLGCAWSDDASVIQNYLSLCAENTHDFTDHPDPNVHLNSVFGAEERCVSLDSPGVEGVGWPSVNSDGGLPEAGKSQGQDERSEVRTHVRVKRGFIVPGTLWCGSGNKALSFADLGVFSDTDSCCREHDQCKDTILSFHSEFGVFNTNIFTMSHCDCDNKFHSCLKEANDRISDVVGYTFFNLLKMNCFEFSHRLQCQQRNWFGMCKETKMSLYAEVHPPKVYESTNPTEAGMNSTIANTTAPAEFLESITSHPQLSSITAAAASTVPTPSTRSPSSSLTPVTNVNTPTVTTISEKPTGSVPESRNHLSTPPIPTLTVTEVDTTITGMQLSCGVYKDLDECGHKILPQRMKYGIYNPEPRTLYHCNCTKRLFQTLVEQRQLTEVHSLLLGRVSGSCFLPQDCTTGKTCTAVLVKADLPQLEQRSGADVEEQRHLQALQLKVRRPNTRIAKRNGRAVKLHRLCLRMTRPKQMNKSRTPGQTAQRPAV
ncbi:group 3 secretory phospholipase A2 [Hippoglossus hippoglossus]|uniref:group 3 secretory phospholipase A2 n=1 Tax=Hippoglossus hippoglossus TaxID=8267 RepID=UPI00148CF54E|nr:group 3 secretory phospholipase A2 [Hippoglossus hippoglossus]